MQMWGLAIGYGATADGNSYAAYTDDTSGENSNNIFPYNILWVSLVRLVCVFGLLVL